MWWMLSALAAPQVTIAPARTSFRLGEPLWIDVTFEADAEAVSVGVSRSIVERPELHVVVTGAAGERAPDPYHRPGEFVISRGVDQVHVAPHQRGTVRIDLARFAWIGAPGVYDVRLNWSFGEVGVEPAATDPGWAATRIEVLPVDAAAANAVVAAHPRQMGDQRYGPLNFWDALGHAVYVPLLEPLAAKSLPETRSDWGYSGSRADERALHGLSACPCPEATEALFRLYDGFDAELRQFVAAELLRRVPGPRGGWFQERAWEPRFDAMLLERGRAALRTPTDGLGWGSAYRFGGEVLLRLGEPQDAVLLGEALQRVATGAPEGANVANQVYGVIQHMTLAIGRFPPPPAAHDPRTAVLLELLLGWNGHQGEPPPGWDDVLLRAFATNDPLVVTAATDRLPRALSEPLLSKMVPWIGTDQLLLQGYLSRRLPQSLAPAFRDALQAELGRTRGPRVPPLIAALRTQLPLEAFLELVLAHVPEHPDLVWQLTAGLDVSMCGGGGRGELLPEEIPTIVAAWTEVLRRKDPLPLPIEAGTDPKLVPRSYRCDLRNGVTWPP
jgi:hypothetical protein